MVTGTQVVTTDKLESTVTYVTLVTVSVSVARVVQAVVVVVAVAISVSTVVSDVLVTASSDEMTVLVLLMVESAVVIVDREFDAMIVTVSAVDVVGGSDVDSEDEEPGNDPDVMVDDSVTVSEVDRVRDVNTEDVKDEVVMSSTVVEPERYIEEDTNESDAVGAMVDSDMNVAVDSNEVKLDVENGDV